MTPKSLRCAIATFLTCGCLVGPTDAASQTVLGATIGLSTQKEGDSDQPYLGPGFGGTTVGGNMFVDANVAERVSLGGEVSLGADISGRQIQRAPGGSNDLQSRHHDTIFSGVLKLGTSPAGRAQIAAVVGLGVGWRRTTRTGTFRQNRPPFTVTPVDQTLSNGVLATTVGFDGAIGISPRTAMAFTGRLHLLKDKDRDPSGVVRRGVASTIFRFGGGARIRF